MARERRRASRTAAPESLVGQHAAAAQGRPANRGVNGHDRVQAGPPPSADIQLLVIEGLRVAVRRQRVSSLSRRKRCRNRRRLAMKLTTELRDAELVLRPTEPGFGRAGARRAGARVGSAARARCRGRGGGWSGAGARAAAGVAYGARSGRRTGWSGAAGVVPVPLAGPVWPVVPGVVVVAPGVVPGLPVADALPDPRRSRGPVADWASSISGSRTMVMGSFRAPAPVPVAPSAAAVPEPAAALPVPPRLAASCRPRCRAAE